MPRTPRLHKSSKESRPEIIDQKKLDSRTDDFALIRQALGGDDNAYKRILNKYHDAIYNFIYRMVRDKPHVEDLTQEAFIKAFASLSTFSEDYAFSTWLYKIATNNTIDYIRKRKLQTYSIDKPIASKDGEFSFELPDQEYETDGELINSQRARMLTQAIEQLPKKYRKVIQLRHVEELSYEEIAKTLRLPIGTVKAHIFRARELLYKSLRNKMRHY